MFTCKITVPMALQHTRTATATSPWFVQDTEYAPMATRYRYLINGETAFTAVHQAIAAAEKSVDIICWGFQPSMYFIRDGAHPAIGELLRLKARQGVRVRVLGWEMPFNAAGVAGEANLPGKGGPKDRAGQSATDQQHAEDQAWFKAYSAADGKAAEYVLMNVPVFVSRGFSLSERKRIYDDVNQHALDQDLSRGTDLALAGAVTHHQKSVLVDYELPEKAVGFVMGHNMLDEYWDTDKHSARNRPDPLLPNAPQYAPDRGPRGFTPRQDISCRVSGPILDSLHRNFAEAWQKETGEDLIAARAAFIQGMPVTVGNVTLRVPYPPSPSAGPGDEAKDTQLLAQLLRTQAQSGHHDIQTLYLQAVNNATQFIYIENQYFRWPALADAIKHTITCQTGEGRKPEEHGALHLFVVTNVTDEGIGKGTVNTQRMLESLGRADTIPEVTKLLRIEKMKQDLPPQPRPDGPQDWKGQRELAEWLRERESKTKAIMDEEIVAKPIPGLKVHVCSLVAPDSPPGKPWMPVYIHSKLMIVNDVFTTHGSANINTRSMMVDSELNIAHEWHDVTQAMRRELWGLHTRCKVQPGDTDPVPNGAPDIPKDAFKAWEEIIKKNKVRQNSKSSTRAPYASLVGFHYDKATLSNLD
ncbi:phospholipase [Pseudomonas nitroreducens]|uniref:Phospholipase n=1 Tax=Pseudomonas nitroreducens TaxID=46680 RepID=A0A5R9A6R2_PSENT|nr:phospholipase [Pseudomonas nitroreducens]TLP73597.1 phospholipase [Pseudomonas nitroreducens]